MDRIFDHILRSGVPRCAELRMKMLEQVMQDRARTSDAGDLPHGRAIKIADPHANREFRRVTKGPIVTEIRAGARLAGHTEIKMQGSFRAERERAGRVVAQYVRD